MTKALCLGKATWCYLHLPKRGRNTVKWLKNPPEIKGLCRTIFVMWYHQL